MRIRIRPRTLRFISTLLILGASCLFLYFATSAWVPAASGEERTVVVRPPMVALPAKAGEVFWMGSSEKEAGRDDDERRHQMRLASPFAISETEVTLGQFEAVMGYNPAVKNREACGLRLSENLPTTKDIPAYCVSWFEAAEYANELTKLEFPDGKDSDGNVVLPCYQAIDADPRTVTWPQKQACGGYRLPTEAEWEYAARACDRWSLFAGTNEDTRRCDFANVAGCREKNALLPVAGLQPNTWGLYDMSGNVWEWVWDWYGDYPTDDVTVDKGGPEAGSVRVLRGGSWWNYPRDARVSVRYGRSPVNRGDYVGFRLSRSSLP